MKGNKKNESSCYQYENQNYFNYHGIIVGVMTDRNNINTFVPIDTLLHTRDYVYEKRSVSFNQYQGNGKNIALKYFYTNGRYYTTNIDNLVVKSCPNVIFSANDGNSIKAEIAQNISPDYFVNIHCTASSLTAVLELVFLSVL